MTKRTKGGDCFEVAATMMVAGHASGTAVELDADAKMVHARITGQGPIEGVIHSHAWVEWRGLAFDFSNGKTVIMPAARFRALARLAGAVIEYDRDETRRLLTSSGHFGPWHPKILAKEIRP